MKVLVPFYGFNKDFEGREKLGSAFLVRPNILVTAGHVVMDDTGSKYNSKGIYFNNTFLQLPPPLYIHYQKDYSIDDTTYHDLALYSLNINELESFNLSENKVE